MRFTPKKIIKAVTPYGVIVAYRIIGPRIEKYKSEIVAKREQKDLYRNMISSVKPMRKVKSPKTIVSLTSYGRRIHTTAHIAAASILRQSKRPDKIVIWLAHGERPSKELLKLKELGLDIEYCDDIKSYKKLIPAINSYPGSTIVTADDDVIYPVDWFKAMMREHIKHPRSILCNKAREISVSSSGEVLPYSEWAEVDENKEYNSRLVPIGIGGVLYPAGSLHADVSNKDLFTRLAPHADDLWFWAMSELKGTNRRLVIDGFKDTHKYELDGVGLWNTVNSHEQNGNSIQFLNILDNFPKLNKRIGSKNSKSEMTGLRIDPNKVESVEQRILFLKHQFAYKYSVDMAKKMNAKTVLDYGCGDGYGSDLMASQLASVGVRGTDIDTNALDEAKLKYKKDNLQFIEIGEMGKYDLIVSFQVIEHVDDVRGYLELLKDHLNDGGRIIITTPDRRYRLNDGQKPWNPFHLREYTKKELELDIGGVFDDFEVHQLTGEKNMLRIEYSRVAGNRDDLCIYGGVHPEIKDKEYELEDLRLSKADTKDSLDLFAIIKT